jgi:hypothetical protein
MLIINLPFGRFFRLYTKDWGKRKKEKHNGFKSCRLRLLAKTHRTKETNMLPSDYIAKLLDVEHLEVTNVEHSEKEILLEVQMQRRFSECPRC